MNRNKQYDILFEPVKIGPVTAPNRFFQVPHCNGMGYLMPNMLATMRGVKAQGGWGVVCTEEVEIHHTSDIHGVEGRLWNDGDIAPLKLMTDAVHHHGSLAGIELVHGGHHTPNLTSRVVPLGVTSRGIDGHHPVQSKAMDKADIQNVRRWHKNAAIRAKKAGFDIIYVYAGHGLALPMQFLSRKYNNRTDEYGGCLENRVRFLRELIEDTKEAVGDTCAVALRFAVDELMGPSGITSQDEGRAIVEMLAELPDLWDVNISDWANDSATSRFEKEGYQQPYTNFVKSVTSKPVVGVGRFTSPDAMVAMVRRGELDFIGSARPSIADPYLPRKIFQGKLDEIRECIGCNICVSSDNLSVAIRCTQNPTMGEEWRKGWHPEEIAPKKSDENVLVVGAGPAGLECALALSKRGYNVTLAEATSELGGRLVKESRLPGLSEWARVVDHRAVLLQQALNVEIYRESKLTAEDILDFGFHHVYIAAGSYWRNDGAGRTEGQAILKTANRNALTPDDLMLNGRHQDGAGLTGTVAIYDDDHYFMGGALAEMLIKAGLQVVIITPASEVSAWTTYTLEQKRIQGMLIELGVQIETNYQLQLIAEDYVEVGCTYTQRMKAIHCDHILLVTDRVPCDTLYKELLNNPAAVEKSGIKKITLIGDALAPGTIAQAVYSGHSEARALNETAIGVDDTPFELERSMLFDVDYIDHAQLEICSLAEHKLS